jgi:hypothetical protein
MSQAGEGVAIFMPRSGPRRLESPSRPIDRR